MSERCSGPLLHLLTKAFRVPPDEAQAMLDDVLDALITRHGANDEDWVFGAVWRVGKEYASAPERQLRAGATPPDREEARLDLLAHAVLATLPENAREALRLRVEERRSYADIATILGVTPRYAKRLVTETWAKLDRAMEGSR